MNTTDPKYREYLRDLPACYLLDLLADNEELNADTARLVLKERGLSAADIEQRINRRRRSRWMKRPLLWRAARWTILVMTGGMTIFNLINLYGLIFSDDVFTVPLLFFAILCTGFGFFLGYKMTTHIYQGGAHQLYCGFPVPVGYVDLKTGTEQVAFSSRRMIASMAINATAGVNLTLFPLMIIYLGVH